MNKSILHIILSVVLTFSIVAPSLITMSDTEISFISFSSCCGDDNNDKKEKDVEEKDIEEKEIEEKEIFITTIVNDGYASFNNVIIISNFYTENISLHSSEIFLPPPENV